MTQPVRLVIFDCDGVLVDSEKLSAMVLAEACAELGFEGDHVEMEQRFRGKTLTLVAEEIGPKVGRTLGPEWVLSLQERVVERLRHEVTAVDGALEMLEKVQALGLPFVVASNSSMEEMEAKFRRIGLWEELQGRLFSGRLVGAPKPAPDVFLEAARASGKSPAECVVVEDSDTGLEAARRAGMRAIVLRAGHEAPPSPEALYRIEHLSELPDILKNMMEG